MTQPPPPSAPPPPGWYRDPREGGSGYRWWDGGTWTERVSDNPSAEQDPDAESTVGEWMSALLGVVQARGGQFFTMVVVLIVPTLLLNGVAGWYALRNVVVTFDSEGGAFSATNEVSGPEVYVYYGFTLVLFAVASVLLVLAATRQSSAMLDERPEPWSDSVLGALPRLWRGVANLTVVMIVLWLFYVVIATIGALLVPVALMIIPLFLGLFWLSSRFSYTAVVSAIAPAEERSLATSWRLSARRFGFLLRRMALLGLFSFSLLLAAQWVSTIFLQIGGGGTPEIVEPVEGEVRLAALIPGDNVASYSITQLFQAIGFGLVLVLWSAGFTVLYRESGGVVETEPDDG
ncbi:MAG: DUF2510 domain-containing protein [Actinomycetota bacterium]